MKTVILDSTEVDSSVKDSISFSNDYVFLLPYEYDEKGISYYYEAEIEDGDLSEYVIVVNSNSRDLEFFTEATGFKSLSVKELIELFSGTDECSGIVLFQPKTFIWKR